MTLLISLGRVGGSENWAAGMPDMFCSADASWLLMGSRQGASVHTTVFDQFSFRTYFKEELPQVFRHSCRSYGLESHAIPNFIVTTTR